MGAIVALIAVLAFGCPAMFMASQGSTIIESQFPMKEYVQIKPQVYCPLGPGFYARTRSENLRVILGPKWWLRLLLPTTGGVLGVQNSVSSCAQLGFNPGPSTAAAKSGDV